MRFGESQSSFSFTDDDRYIHFNYTMGNIQILLTLFFFLSFISGRTHKNDHKNKIISNRTNFKSYICCIFTCAMAFSMKFGYCIFENYIFFSFFCLWFLFETLSFPHFFSFSFSVRVLYVGMHFSASVRSNAKQMQLYSFHRFYFRFVFSPNKTSSCEFLIDRNALKKDSHQPV